MSFLMRTHRQIFTNGSTLNYVEENYLHHQKASVPPDIGSRTDKTMEMLNRSKARLWIIISITGPSEATAHKQPEQINKTN